MTRFEKGSLKHQIKTRVFEIDDNDEILGDCSVYKLQNNKLELGKYKRTPT